MALTRFRVVNRTDEYIAVTFWGYFGDGRHLLNCVFPAKDEQSPDLAALDTVFSRDFAISAKQGEKKAQLRVEYDELEEDWVARDMKGHVRFESNDDDSLVTFTIEGVE